MCGVAFFFDRQGDFVLALCAWVLSFTSLVGFKTAFFLSLCRNVVHLIPNTFQSKAEIRNKIEKIKACYIQWLFAIILLAAGLRLIGLEAVPPYMDSDEGRQGLHIMSTFFNNSDGEPSLRLFQMGWNSLPNLSYLLQSVGIFFFGNTIQGLRLSSAIFGVLTLPFFFLIARRLFGIRTALFALVFLCFGRATIEWCRMGTTNIQSALIQALAFSFFAKGLKTQSSTSWTVSGICAGIGMHLYHASKVLPLVLICFFTLAAVFKRGFFRSNLKNFFRLVIGFLIAWGPLAIWTVENWNITYTATNDRTLHDDIINLITAGEYSETGQLLLDQTVASFAGIFIRHGTLPFGYSGPMVDTISAIFVSLGILICLVNIHKLPYLFLMTWFLVTIFFGSILTINPPHHPRLVGLFLCLYLFAGIGVNWVSSFRPKHSRTISTVFLGAILTVSCLINFKNYFFDFPNQRGFHAGTQLTKYLSSIPANSQVSVFGSEDSAAWNEPNIAFVTFGKSIQGLNYGNISGNMPLNRSLNLPQVFIFISDVMPWINTIKSFYSGTEYWAVNPHDSEQGIAAYLVGPEDISARHTLSLDCELPGGSWEKVPLQTNIFNSPQLLEQCLGRRARVYGGWWVPQQAEYEFMKVGDAYLNVKIDQKTILDDQVTSINIGLAKGWHPIEVETTVPNNLLFPKVLFKAAGHNDWRSLLTAQENFYLSYPGGLLRKVQEQHLIDPALAIHWSKGRDYEEDFMTLLPFSLYWSGEIKIEEPGRYTFVSESNGTVSVMLGDNIVIKRITVENRNAFERDSAEVVFDKAGRYKVVIDVAAPELTDWGQFKFVLSWAPPGKALQLIPTTAMSPFSIQ